MSVILVVLAVEWLGTLALLCLCDDPDEERIYRNLQAIIATGICILVILNELVHSIHIGVG